LPLWCDRIAGHQLVLSVDAPPARTAPCHEESRLVLRTPLPAADSARSKPRCFLTDAAGFREDSGKPHRVEVECGKPWSGIRYDQSVRPGRATSLDSRSRRGQTRGV